MKSTLLVTALISCADAFVFRPTPSSLLTRPDRVATSLGAAPSGSNEPGVDALLDEMLEAAPYDIPGIVSRSIKLVSNPSFFMAIAARADKEKSDEKKDQLNNLANSVVSCLEVIVQRTEEKVDTSAELLQEVLKSAAEDDGEFLVPLAPDKRQALRESMRDALEADAQALDESFLSTVNAYMKKCQDDGLTGMVPLLQAVLQTYASIVLASDVNVDVEAEAESAAGLLDKLLASDPAGWGALAAHELAKPSSPCGSADDLLSEVQARIETVVLGAGAGTYAQRVQAEFLRELMDKIKGDQGNVVVE